MFKKGEICIVNEEGAEYFNKHSERGGGVKIKEGYEVVCRDNHNYPFCTPINNITCGDYTDCKNITCGDYTDCKNTWSLSDKHMKSTGEFMELD